MSEPAAKPAASGGGGKAVAAIVLLVLLAVGVGLVVASVGIEAFGAAIGSFIQRVGLAMRQYPGIAILIAAIPVAITMGIVFIAIKKEG
jgi:hypothetical protein